MKEFPRIKRVMWASINRSISEMLVKKYPEISLKAIRVRFRVGLVILVSTFTPSRSMFTIH